MLTPKDIEQFNYNRYEHDYTVAHISMHKENEQQDYFRKLIDVRLGYLHAYAKDKDVLDIGCGRGDYLFEINPMIRSGHGIDYTQKAIDAAKLLKEEKQAHHLDFTKANAKELPFKEGSFDLVFSFSALAYIPDVGKVINEVSRVLRPGGAAILELGNQDSLNTIVCNACPELTKPCHVPVRQMKQMIRASNLQLMDWRAFGILPFWEQRPTWLKPLLSVRWKHIFQKEIKGKMIDEWVSNSFLFKPWAYRHFLFCRKGKI